MAIETMKKIRLAAHKSASDDVFANIQKLGCCQIIPGSHEKVGESDVVSLRLRARHIEELLGEVRSVMRFLDPYATNKGGGMAKALGDVPSYSASELAALASEDELKQTAERVRSLEKRLSEAKSGISRVGGMISSLAPIAGIPYSLDFYTKGTGVVQGSILQVPAPIADEFVSRVRSDLGDAVEVFVLPGSAAQTHRTVSVIYARDAADKFQAAVSAFQTSRVEVPSQLSGFAADELKGLNAELAGLKSEESAVIGEISGIADAAYKRCEHCSDYWGIQRDKMDALIDGEQTAQVIVSEFWMPERRLNGLKNVLTPFSTLTDFVVSDPEEGDTPPTLLHNKGLALPVEPLISMFGTPTYGGYDPTAIVAPFFYAFFGICFGDAAYGLIISSLLIALMMKKKVTGVVRQFVQIMIIGNICALIFGALTFSWFGDSIEAFKFLQFLKPLSKLQILDPMNDPMTMLYVSLAFGFVHILIGLLLAMRENLRKGDVTAALADQGGWILFLCSLVLYGLASAGVVGIPAVYFKYAAIAGAVILVATQGRSKEGLFGKLLSGLLSLYNVSGYLGDLLSYSRLLALGLCSAAVGVVVNLLANLVAPVPYVGVVLAIAIFLVGHVFSIAVNVLGAFVHSLRLQYVEFFGKFHSADGNEFTPLSVSTQYVEISE